MTTFLLAAVIFGILFAGMAIGVIFQNKPLKGTCGGLNQFNDGECEICGGDPDKCESETDTEAAYSRNVEKAGTASLAYDAAKSK
ncbi:MAG: (Na+)-NQR maturation NqrM [Pseudomonadales bacterium]|nr:(Na+)-NQR maturation NqrM [Pseudomonadales bacterium]